MSYKYDKLFDEINEFDLIENLTLGHQRSEEWACEDGSSYYAGNLNSDNRNFVNIKCNKLIIKMEAISQLREDIKTKEKIFKIYKNEILKNQNFCLKQQNCTINLKTNLQIKKKRMHQQKKLINQKKEAQKSLIEQIEYLKRYNSIPKKLVDKSSRGKEKIFDKFKEFKEENITKKIEIYGLNYNNIKRRLLENLLILHSIDDRYGGFCIVKETKLILQSEMITESEIRFIEGPNGFDLILKKKNIIKDLSITIDDNSIEGKKKEFALTKIKKENTSQSIWLYKPGDTSSVQYWDPIFHNINLFMSQVANICSQFNIYCPILIERGKHEYRYHLINQNGDKIYIDLESSYDYESFVGLLYVSASFLYVYNQLTNGNITISENKKPFFELDKFDYTIEKIESFVTNLKSMQTLGPNYKSFQDFQDKEPLVFLQKNPKIVYDQQYFCSSDEIYYKVVHFYDGLCLKNLKSDIILQIESIYEQNNGGISRIASKELDYYYQATIDQYDNIKQSLFQNDMAISMKVWHLCEKVTENYPEIFYNKTLSQDNFAKKIKSFGTDDLDSSFTCLDVDEFTVIY